jgi:TonB dependent receptor/Carboxypeptidase regulatory-like domain/TonB-dependent Receptor Plug Domain
MSTNQLIRGAIKRASGQRANGAGTMCSAAMLVSLILGVATAPVHAQSNTEGAIAGYVRKAENQTVIVKSTNTGLTREVTPDANGRFAVTSLPTGPYSVTVKESGKPDVEALVTVGVGSTANVRFDQLIESVVVTGDRQREVLVDTASVESALSISFEDVAKLPVARGLTEVALLAPGVIEGDLSFRANGGSSVVGFESLASFGGATVGENAYYINGFNVTNFRNGLGGSNVPFQAYQDFQIKTGGYSAEFGRSTGGVINTTTKRGTNTWEFGVSTFYQPDAWTAHSSDVRAPNGSVSSALNKDTFDSLEANIEAGGPVIQDRLFVYGIYSYRDREVENSRIGLFDVDERKDPFWLVKLDAHITDDHILEFTGFSDQDDVDRATFVYDADDQVRGASVGTSTLKRGGENFIGKYTGYITDTFNVSALYGTGKYNRTDVGEGDVCPLADDISSGTTVNIGCWTSQQPGTSMDEREAYRLDAEWALGRHQLRLGYDHEENTSSDAIAYSGGVWWRYGVVAPDGTLNTATGLTPGTPYVRRRFYENIGDFAVETSAFYLEDNWQVTDSLLLSLGIRNETFDNRNALDETFIKISDQWAPRLGFAWDVRADGRSKLFGSYGRYYLPIASNTNARMSGAENFYEEYYLYSGVNPGTADPTALGAQIGPRQTFANGEVPDVRQIVNRDIDPMYQEEFIVGFQQQLSQNWAAGVRATYRDLKVAIEDVAVDAALNAYAAENGFADFEAGGFDYYVLTNPGEDVKMSVDLDDDGILDDVSLSADALGYPEAKRRYIAVDLFFQRAFDGLWALQGSYTWSHNYGNNEGYVRSDNGQDDAGITTAFDQPGLTQGANGNLPNDRRHQVKLFGVYQVLPELAVSANARALSGRPVNCFGVHPTDAFAAEYGHESFFCGGEVAPRGSAGNLPWQYKLDLGVEYRPAFFDNSLSVKLDVFNVLNSQKAVQIVETGELDDGGVDPKYRLPVYYQSPRSVRLSASYNFKL